MDKKQVINELIRIYDENAELSREVQKYKNASAANRGVGELGTTDPMASITVLCIDAGRKAIWNSIIDKYHLGMDYEGKYDYGRCSYKVYVKSDREEGGYAIITFDQWIKTLDYRILETDSYSGSSSRDYYLKAIKAYSLNELIEFFSPELREVYDGLVNSFKMKIAREAREGKEKDE